MKSIKGILVKEHEGVAFIDALVSMMPADWDRVGTELRGPITIAVEHRVFLPIHEWVRNIIKTDFDYEIQA